MYFRKRAFRLVLKFSLVLFLIFITVTILINNELKSYETGENENYQESLWRPTDEFTGKHDYDDRLVQQLELVLQRKPTTKKKIALFSGFTSWYFDEDVYHKECPTISDFCKFVETNTNLEMRNTDAVLIHFSSSYEIIPENITRIVYILESNYHAHASISGNDLLASYWRGSDIVTPYGKWVYNNNSMEIKKPAKNYAEGKFKMAAMFVSNCYTPNNRMEYVKQLQKHISVDIYGACGTLTCPRSDDSCNEKLRKEYKFYLAFENSNCRDYITEKFFHNALRNDIVPVVMGAHPKDYEAAAPFHSYIHIDDFSDAEALGNYLKHLDTNDDDYNEFFKWKGSGEFINLKFFCRVCAMLHYSDHVSIPNRQVNFEWSMSSYDGIQTRPCLPEEQIHWN